MNSAAAPLTKLILRLIGDKPGLSDRDITNEIFGKQIHPSQVNQTCRQLEAAGRLVRKVRTDGRIGNYGIDIAAAVRAITSTSRSGVAI